MGSPVSPLDPARLRAAYEQASADPDFGSLSPDEQDSIVEALASSPSSPGADSISVPGPASGPGGAMSGALASFGEGLTSLPWNMLKGVAKSIARPIYNIGSGIVRNSWMGGAGATDAEEKQIQGALASRGVGETIGDVGGSTAQFFIPGPALEAAGGAKLAAMLKSSPRLFSLLKSAAGGLDDAALTLAQTKSPEAAVVSGGLGAGSRAAVAALPSKQAAAEKLSELSQGALRNYIGGVGKEGEAAASQFLPELTQRIDAGTLPRSLSEGKKVFGGMREAAGRDFLSAEQGARVGTADPADLIAKLDEIRQPFASKAEATPDQLAALENVREELLTIPGGMDEATLRQIAPQLFDEIPPTLIPNAGAESQFRIPTGQIENLAREAAAGGGQVPRSKIVDFLDPLRSSDAAASRAERAAITEQTAPGVVKGKVADTMSDFLDPNLGPAYDRARMMKNIEEGFAQKWGTSPGSPGIGTVSATQALAGGGLLANILNIPEAAALIVAPRIIRSVMHSPRWPAMEAIYARKLEQAVAAGRLDVLGSIAEEIAPGTVSAVVSQAKQEGVIE